MMTHMRLIPLTGLLSLTAILLTACPSTTPVDSGKTPIPEPTNAITPPLVIPATTTRMFNVRGSSTMPDHIVKDAQLAASRWDVLLTGRAAGNPAPLEPITLYVINSGSALPATAQIDYRRPATMPGTGLPLIGTINLSDDFIKNFNQNRRLSIDILTHEIGHVLGIGSLWNERQFVSSTCMNDPQPSPYLGRQAAANWTAAQPTRGPLVVENNKTFGAPCVHWNKNQMGRAVMATLVSGGTELTDVDRGALADLGWEVTNTPLTPISTILPASAASTVDLSGDVQP